jgi:hypothetical protein
MMAPATIGKRFRHGCAGTGSPFRLFLPRYEIWELDIMLGTILIIILILMLLGALPSWGYSRSWGYGPSGGLGLILVILIILVLLGRV